MISKCIIGLIIFIVGFYQFCWWHDGRTEEIFVVISSLITMLGGAVIAIAAASIKKTPAEKKSWLNNVWKLIAVKWPVIKLKLAIWSLFILLLSEGLFLKQYIKTPHLSLLFVLILQITFIITLIAFLWGTIADKIKNIAKAIWS